MRLGIIVAGIVAGLIPAIAVAQQANQQQLQGVIDHGTAVINTTVAQWGAQIVADQVQIETLSKQNDELKKKLADQKPEAPAGPPQLGTGK